jgi:hypothetical protein
MKKIDSPPLIAIYGGPGIGKTSFSVGANASNNYNVGLDNHLLINIDYRGADRLTCHRASDLLGRPIQSTDDLNFIFRSLAENDNPFNWITFDDLSTLEELFVREVCETNNVTEIGKIEYGRGYELAKVKWYHFFDCIKQLQETKNIGVILIGHTKIEKQKDPMTESYSRHDLELDNRSKVIIKKAVELIGFAHKKTFTKETDSSFGKKETVAIGKSKRILTFAPDIEGFESKDRFNLPEEIDLDWSVFIAELNKSLGIEVKKTKTQEKK